MLTEIHDAELVLNDGRRILANGAVWLEPDDVREAREWVERTYGAWDSLFRSNLDRSWQGLLDVPYEYGRIGSINTVRDGTPGTLVVGTPSKVIVRPTGFSRAPATFGQAVFGESRFGDSLGSALLEVVGDGLPPAMLRTESNATSELATAHEDVTVEKETPISPSTAVVGRVTTRAIREETIRRIEALANELLDTHSSEQDVVDAAHFTLGAVALLKKQLGIIDEGRRRLNLPTKRTLDALELIVDVYAAKTGNSALPPLIRLLRQALEEWGRGPQRGALR